MPRVVDSVGRREEIARAAMEIFKRRGYRSTNLGEVAAECGIARSTLYEYFPSKQALIEYCVRSILISSGDDIERIARDNELTWKEKILAYLRLSMGRVWSDPEQTLVSLEYMLDLYGSRSGKARGNLAARVRAGLPERAEARIERILREANSFERLSDREIRELAISVHGLVLSFCLQSLINPNLTTARAGEIVKALLDSWIPMAA